MADKEISSLTADSALDGTEVVHVKQASNSRKSTTSEIRYAGLQGCLVKKSADLTGQNVTTAGGVAVAWNTETYDYGGWHDTVTNNSRMTVPTGVSRVRVMAQISVVNVTANNWIAITIKKNGSIVYVGNGQTITGNAGTTVNGQVETAILEVVATDYFEVFVQSQSDTSIDFVAADCWMLIEKMSD